MGKVEVQTLYNGCHDGCQGFDVSEGTAGWKCSKMWLCKYGANAMLKELQTRFEHEEHEAYKKDAVGLKEPAVWNRAIRILEEYME